VKVLQFDSGTIADPSGLLGSAEMVIQAEQQQPVVVVAAMGSSSETLRKAGQRSAHQDVVLASTLAEGSRTYHMQVAEQITSGVWPETKKSLSNLFDEITDLLKGLYLLGELSPRSEKVLQFYAEGLAATILAQTLKEKGYSSQCLFNRELFVQQVDQPQEAGTGTLSELQQEVDSLLAEKTVPVVPLSLASLNLDLG
jgi:aspartokinase